MFEMPRFSITVAPENALLQMWDLVEAIHVELPDERRKLLMLEPATEDEALKVEEVAFAAWIKRGESVS